MNAHLAAEGLATESASEVKKTPLFETHKAHNARFTEFSGWNMPVSYSGLTDEHHTVRKSCGLFDVSHMGEIFVRGPRALQFLQYVTSNDVSQLKPHQAQYSLLLNPKGGVVDDIIVYKFSDENYLLCVNAGNTEKDWAWLNQHNQEIEAELENASSRYGQIAVQGPNARTVLATLFATSPETFSLAAFPAFTFQEMKLALNGKPAVPLIIACTGYTGEDGFEIFCPAEVTTALWENLMKAGAPLGIKPAGLGARDTLRLEVCYPLHGHELGDNISALAAGLLWVIKFEKGDFIGKAALVKEKGEGVNKRLVGLEVIDRGIIREGAKLFSTTGEEIGWVTSGTKPPTVDKPIGLGYVPVAYAKIGTSLKADVRGKLLDVQVISKPFYKREK